MSLPVCKSGETEARSTWVMQEHAVGEDPTILNRLHPLKPSPLPPGYRAPSLSESSVCLFVSPFSLPLNHCLTCSVSAY